MYSFKNMNPAGTALGGAQPAHLALGSDTASEVPRLEQGWETFKIVNIPNEYSFENLGILALRLEHTVAVGDEAAYTDGAERSPDTRRL